MHSQNKHYDITVCSRCADELVDIFVERVVNRCCRCIGKGNHFKYSWILILNSFVAWAESPDYKGVDVPVQCLREKYHNLWYYKEKYTRIFAMTRRIHNSKEITMLNFICKVRHSSIIFGNMEE